jgi:hypothetical protein
LVALLDEQDDLGEVVAGQIHDLRCRRPEVSEVRRRRVD